MQTYCFLSEDIESNCPKCSESAKFVKVEEDGTRFVCTGCGHEWVEGFPEETLLPERDDCEPNYKQMAELHQMGKLLHAENPDEYPEETSDKCSHGNRWDECEECVADEEFAYDRETR